MQRRFQILRSLDGNGIFLRARVRRTGNGRLLPARGQRQGGGPRHLRQIETSDRYIGEIWDAYEKAGILDETLFMVIADHGGIRHGHGGYTHEEKYIFFGMAGKTVAETGIRDFETVDVAATVLHALGLEVPAYDPWGFASQVPEGVFPDWDRPYIKAKPVPSRVKNMPTPGFASDKGLSAFFPLEEIALALFLDDDLKDETGRHVFRETGAVKFYSDGVNGSCGEFGRTGCAVTQTLADFGRGSFTVAAWLNVDRSIREDCVVCANMSWWWQDRNVNGFAFILKNNDTVLCVGCPEDHEDVVTPLPAEIEKGWVHVIAAVDKEKNEVRIYTNFARTRAMPVAAALLADNSAPVFCVGDDVRGKNNTEDFPNLFRMDAAPSPTKTRRSWSGITARGRDQNVPCPRLRGTELRGLMNRRKGESIWQVLQDGCFRRSRGPRGT